MALLSIGEILDLGNSANMSSYIPYSALDYDPTGAISGISGSAIAGGVESSVVSSIVSSMVSSKADQSALEDCCSSMSSVVSSIQNDVSGISSYVSGLTGEYLEKSASSMFAPSGNYMSASESSSFYPMTGNPSGFLTGVDLSDYATTAYVDSSVSGKMDATASGYLQPSGDYAYNSSLSSYLYASASSNFQPSGNYQTAGDYAYNSAVSSKLDASASSEFYLTSNPSGFITGVDLDGYATTSYVDSSVSGKMDKSESSSFYPMTGNPSGFLTSVDLSDYATTAYVDSSVSSKLDSSASSSFYTVDNPSGFITGVDLSEYQPTSAMTSYQPSGDYAYNSSLSSYVAYSAISGENSRITSISGSAVGGDVPPTAELIINTATMSGSSDDSSNYHIGVRGDVFVNSSSMSSYATTADLSQKLSTAAFASYTAGVIPVVIVANSADATAANTVYVVTGESS